MYAQQARTGVPELDAVLATAQMVTPDKTPTVAAQVAQAAQEKLQPQGIMQGMSQARQDYAAAAPLVDQNMRQRQFEQQFKQMMAPKPVGIEGVQSNIGQYKEGGIIGYNGEEGSSVDTKLMRMTPEEYERKRREAMARGAPPERIRRTPEEEAIFSRLSAVPPMQELPVPEVVSAPFVAPEAQRLMDRQRVPAPRPPAPPAAPSAPQAGIAQLVAPTPESAMASARSTLGLGDTTAMRAREDAYLAALKAQPATGQQGLAALQAQQAALQAQQADLQRGHEKAEKESNINSAIQWLLGGREGPGGSARASRAFDESETARRKSYRDQQTTYGELQVANATKRDAIIDLEKARNVGNAKAAVEAEQRIRAADMEIAKAEGNLAASFASSQANVYGTQVRSQDEAANRASQLQIARIQAAARNDPQSKEAMAVARVQQAVNGSRMLQELAKAAAMGLPGAQEKYDAEEAKLYQRLAPELLQGAGAAPALAPPPAGAVRVKGGG